MKRIRCPKCETPIIFEEKNYEPGRTLVFECHVCKKQFKIKLSKPKTQEEKSQEEKPVAEIIVIENAFHFKQVIPLYPGKNIIGRYVKGTKGNATFKTVDPSIDTTHCSINIKKQKDRYQFVLKDEKSNTGTFYLEDFLGSNEQVNLNDEDIFTLGATTIIFRNKNLESI